MQTRTQLYPDINFRVSAAAKARSLRLSNIRGVNVRKFMRLQASEMLNDVSPEFDLSGEATIQYSTFSMHPELYRRLNQKLAAMDLPLDGLGELIACYRSRA